MSKRHRETSDLGVPSPDERARDARALRHLTAQKLRSFTGLDASEIAEAAEAATFPRPTSDTVPVDGDTQPPSDPHPNRLKHWKTPMWKRRSKFRRWKADTAEKFWDSQYPRG